MLRGRRLLLGLAALALVTLAATASALALSHHSAKRGLKITLAGKALRSGDGKHVRITGKFRCGGAVRTQLIVYVSQKSSGTLATGRFPDFSGLKVGTPKFKKRYATSVCRGTRAWRAGAAVYAASGRAFRNGKASACAVAYAVTKKGSGDMTSRCRTVKIHH